VLKWIALRGKASLRCWKSFSNFSNASFTFIAPPFTLNQEGNFISGFFLPLEPSSSGCGPLFDCSSSDSLFTHAVDYSNINRDNEWKEQNQPQPKLY
jgi:hypothetical protein